MAPTVPSIRAASAALPGGGAQPPRGPSGCRFPLSARAWERRRNWAWKSANCWVGPWRYVGA